LTFAPLLLLVVWCTDQTHSQWAAIKRWIVQSKKYFIDIKGNKICFIFMRLNTKLYEVFIVWAAINITPLKKHSTLPRVFAKKCWLLLSFYYLMVQIYMCINF
jgi:hypothetical protein